MVLARRQSSAASEIAISTKTGTVIITIEHDEAALSPAKVPHEAWHAVRCMT
jgi:hypothetical protein